jgi:hypothetical protein
VQEEAKKRGASTLAHGREKEKGRRKDESKEKKKEGMGKLIERKRNQGQQRSSTPLLLVDGG